MTTFKKPLAAALSMLSLLWASAAIDNPQSVSQLLDRVAGAGAGSKIETTVDDTYASGSGAEMFMISTKNGKPWVKGTTLSAVTTGLGWYLNHNAGVNLTWNFPKTTVTDFPLPQGTEEHTTSAKYRYYLNYCTFSYSMSTWTWERWQEEIDWMALRGINMPLQIIGLEEVWRKFLMEDYGYSQDEVNAYVGGPCYMAWFGMNNLEGWGGPNPDWWYKRQAQLGKQIGDRMRSLGIEPVLPGFCQVPSNFTAKTGILAAGQGNWCGFKRPFLANPADENFDACAAKFYARVKEVMGESKYYSMDPFHEGGSVALDAPILYQRLYKAMNDNNPGSKWVIQSWQWNGKQRESISNVPTGELIVLDLFSDGNPAWGSYGNQPVVFSTIFNFGGRTGYFGRAQSVIDGYWNAKTQKSTVVGIGAAPEAIEQTPVVYDLLFELPWCSEKPDAKKWFKEYSARRYGVDNELAADAWELIRTSALDRQGGGQGPHEALMCARPNLNGNKVSTWGFNELYYDPNMLIEAAYKLLDANLTGQNYSFDLTDISRQALTDYVRKLIPAMRQANSSGDTELFNKRRDAFLQLMLDIDELLNTNSEFMLGHWTERARKMADEVPGTTVADRDWLELNNARQLITTWGANAQAEGGGLRDYSYRQWGGLMKDYYYARWKKWFDDGMKAPNWFQWEWDWAHTNPGIYPTEPIGDSHEVAARILPKYLSPFTVAGQTKPAIYVPRLISTDASSEVVDKAARDQEYLPDFIINGTQIAEIAIDFNKSNLYEESEISRDPEGSFVIPADAPVGERKCRITLDDGTVFTYTLSIIEDITEPRTVTVKTSDPAKGSVSIEGTTALSVTNTEIVKILATPTQKYDFAYWTDKDGNEVGNDNPMSYYSKEPAEFTAHFIENKWGVPGFFGDINKYPLDDMVSYGQYLISLGIVQGPEDKTFFETDTPPTEPFYYVSKRIKAAPGGAFHFKYQGKGGKNTVLDHLFLSAYCDLNADGIFDINTNELLGTKGTHKAMNNTVGQGGFDVLLPYDIPQGTTHIRLRFDGAWLDSDVPNSWVDLQNHPSGATGAFKPDVATNRIIYEILLEVNDGVDYAANVTVKVNNDAFGTVRSENSTNVYLPGEKVILTAFPGVGYRISHWEDQHGRTLPTEWMNGNMIEFTAFDNADITAILEPVPVEVDLWKFNLGVDDEGELFISELVEAGEPDLNLSAEHCDFADNIYYINPEVFAGNTILRELTLPDKQLYKKGALLNKSDVIVGHTDPGTGDRSNQVVTFLKDANGNNYTMNNTPFNYSKPFTLKITGYNNGESFNQYGSVLFAKGDDGLGDSFANGWSQFYLRKDGTIDVKWTSATATHFPVNVYGKFNIIVEYLGDNNTRITVNNSAGESYSQLFSNHTTMKNLNRFATDLPEGMWVQVRISEPDTPVIPGELLLGCSSLMDIHVTKDNQYAVEKKGVIYDKTGANCIAYPEGRILGGAFSLKTGNGTGELMAAPVLTDGNYSNLAISTTTQTTNWNTLWTIDHDGSLNHYNSGLGVGSDGHTLSTDEAKFNYALAYDEGEPSIMFTDANNHYMTPTGLSSDKFSFDFYPVTELTVPDGTIRTVAFPVNVIVPDDTEVFSLDKVGTKGGYMSHIMPGHIIPAGTGVLVEGPANPFEITSTPSAESPDLLDGTTVDLVLSTPFYVLEGENFVRKASGTVPANTGYVPAGLLEVAQFRYKPADYHPVEINGWKFDWRYSYNESAICLTSAVEVGDPALDLSKPVEETGDVVVDIDPAMFVNHTGLTEVILPANRLAHHYYNSSMEGTGEPNHVLNLPHTLSGNTPWQMTMELTSNGNGFNQWGSGLFATGTKATETYYWGGFQLYLQVNSNGGGHIICKYNGTTEKKFDQVPINTADIKNGAIQHFTITFNYTKDAGGNFTTNIKLGCNGKTQTIKLENYKLNPISSFCASIPVGVNIESLHLEGEEIFFPYNEGELFSGCSNLQNIRLASGADYALESDGVLYDINNQQNCIAFPEGRLFSRPFVLTSDGDVTIGASPVLVNDELTETDVTLSSGHSHFNTLWTLGVDKHLTHVNTGAHLNALGNGVSATHGEFGYKLIYGDGDPSLQFSLNEETHLSITDDALHIGDEPHSFRFIPVKSLEATVETNMPHIVTFPVPVIVGEDAVVKGVQSIDNDGAKLFVIEPGTLVPAGHAMITFGGDGNFLIADAPVQSRAASISDNLLRGTTCATSLDEPYYVVEGKSFARHTSGVVPANTAYIPANNNLNVDLIRYDVDDPESVGKIETISDSVPGDVVFDLTGRRVKADNLRPGFYIRNGKKIFIR